MTWRTVFGQQQLLFHYYGFLCCDQHHDDEIIIYKFIGDLNAVCFIVSPLFPNYSRYYYVVVKMKSVHELSCWWGEGGRGVEGQSKTYLGQLILEL